MGDAGWLLEGTEFAWRELALFAASGFLVLGLSDLAVDLIWIARTLWRRWAIYRRYERARADTLRAAEQPGFLAVFIPAWDEAAVIGDMLRNTLRVFVHADYRLYVGCYSNDPATIVAVEAIADPRVRMVVNAAAGPTTKADCLNCLWRALLADEVVEGREAKAVVLHDAEDVVHSAELACDRPLWSQFSTR